MKVQCAKSIVRLIKNDRFLIPPTRPRGEKPIYEPSSPLHLRVASFSAAFSSSLPQELYPFFFLFFLLLPKKSIRSSLHGFGKVGSVVLTFII